MRYVDFIAHVQKLGDFKSEDQTRRVLNAVAQTLSERLPGVEVRRLAEALPKEFGGLFKPVERYQEFGVDEFMTRVSDRAGEQVKDLVRQVRAVTEAIQEAVPGEIMSQVYWTLPYDVRQLFDAGPAPDQSRSVSI